MAQMEPCIYTLSHASCYDSTIGGHVRHNLDHFLCLEQGLKSGSVDYDARERDEFLETDRVQDKFFPDMPHAAFFWSQ